VGWSTAINPTISETITVESVDALFIHRFPHPNSGKPVSLAASYQCFLDDPGKVRKPDASFIRLERLPELNGEDVLPGFRCPVRELFRTPGQKKPSFA
jgi:hypothetical protein